MITKRNKMLLLSITLLFCTSLRTNAQVSNDIGICVEVDTFSTSLIRIELPCGYKKKIYKYEEGTFIDYYYKDGSIITLFKGALQKTPLFANNENYITNRIDTLSNKTIIRGVIRDKVWREDSFEEISVGYEKVPVDKRNIFDNALDKLSVLKVKQ